MLARSGRLPQLTQTTGRPRAAPAPAAGAAAARSARGRARSRGRGGRPSRRRVQKSFCMSMTMSTVRPRSSGDVLRRGGQRERPRRRRRRSPCRPGPCPRASGSAARCRGDAGVVALAHRSRPRQASIRSSRPARLPTATRRPSSRSVFDAIDDGQEVIPGERPDLAREAAGAVGDQQLGFAVAAGIEQHVAGGGKAGVVLEADAEVEVAQRNPAPPRRSSARGSAVAGRAAAGGRRRRCAARRDGTSPANVKPAALMRTSAEPAGRAHRT